MHAVHPTVHPLCTCHCRHLGHGRLSLGPLSLGPVSAPSTARPLSDRCCGCHLRCCAGAAAAPGGGGCDSRPDAGALGGLGAQRTRRAAAAVRRGKHSPSKGHVVLSWLRPGRWLGQKPDGSNSTARLTTLAASHPHSLLSNLLLLLLSLSLSPARLPLLLNRHFIAQHSAAACQLARHPTGPCHPAATDKQEALRRDVPPAILAETLPQHWAAFVRNAPIDQLSWGTRQAPQQRQPFAAPGSGPPQASYTSGSATAVYYGRQPAQPPATDGQQQQQQQQQEQQQP